MKYRDDEEFFIVPVLPSPRQAPVLQALQTGDNRLIGSDGGWVIQYHNNTFGEVKLPPWELDELFEFHWITRSHPNARHRADGYLTQIGQVALDEWLDPKNRRSNALTQDDRSILGTLQRFNRIANVCCLCVRTYQSLILTCENEFEDPLPRFREESRADFFTRMGEGEYSVHWGMKQGLNYFGNDLQEKGGSSSKGILRTVWFMYRLGSQLYLEHLSDACVTGNPQRKKQCQVHLGQELVTLSRYIKECTYVIGAT